MPADTDGDVAVVRPHYAVEEAYSDGYDRFEGVEADAREEFDFAHFQETATWANTVQPGLRAAAGFADAGHGTYTEHREVAAIHPGCEEDTPAEADLVDARRILTELITAYQHGATDAALGHERDCPELWV